MKRYTTYLVIEANLNRIKVKTTSYDRLKVILKDFDIKPIYLAKYAK